VVKAKCAATEIKIGSCYDWGYKKLSAKIIQQDIHFCKTVLPAANQAAE